MNVVIQAPRHHLRERFSVGLPAREVWRRLLWRPPRHQLVRQYLMHDLWYHGLQLGWAYARRLTGQRRVESLRVDTARVPIQQLPPAFEGFRIVQLTDVHAGPPFPMYYIEHAVELALAQPADLYALTGDFITVWPEDAEAAATALEPLARRRPAYACLGNHDVWNDREAVARALEAHGITVLRNRGVPLERNGQVLWLAGVDDARHGTPDLDLALRGAPEGAPVVLLAHEPDFGDAVGGTGRVALQLSGHTHGGQIVLPYFGPLNLPELGRLYPPGLVRVDGLWVYTSRGVWASWPVRLNSPAEVSVVELMRGDFEPQYRNPWTVVRGPLPRMRRRVSR